MSGIGLITAMTILAEWGNLNRFRRRAVVPRVLVYNAMFHRITQKKIKS